MERIISWFALHLGLSWNVEWSP